MLLLWEMQPDSNKRKEESFCETSALVMEERFTKTLYYGEMPDEDCPSLPLTDIAVEYFQEVAPRKLGRVDQILASSVASRACATPCSVMMSMIYAKRLRHRNPDYLDTMSSSDLFLISMMMASKFMYDEGVDEEVFNDEWAEAGDIELTEINHLEQEFLQAIDWQLFVKREEFFSLVNQIEQRVALQQALDRGWFSYTDLYVLTRNSQFSDLWSKIGADWLQVVFIGSTAYMAGFITLVGSTIIALKMSTAMTVIGTAMLVSQQPNIDPVQPNVGTIHPHVGTMKPISFDLIHSDTTNISLSETMATSMKNNTNLKDLASTDFSTEKPFHASTSTSFDQQNSSEVSHVNLLEALIQKLFTLITLKETLIQFVCAVSENYRSPLRKRPANQKHVALARVNQSDYMNMNSHFCYDCVSVDQSNIGSEVSVTGRRNCQLCPNCFLRNLDSSFYPSSKDSETFLTSQHFTTYLPSANQKLVHGRKVRTCSLQQPCCCEEPPGFVDRLVDTSLRFTTRAQVPISIGA